MTNPRPYTDIGPFKYVPEQARSRCASAANLASDRAYDAALRALRDLDGSAEANNGVHPSPVAVAASWDEEGERTKERNSINLTFMMTAPFSGFFLLMGTALIAASFCDKRPNFGLGLGSTLLVFGIIALIVMYFSGYRDLLRMRRELDTQGFIDNTMPDALASAATNVWLLGSQALVIAEPGEEDTPKTRTVFYDAIGTATVTVEDGLEGVTITTRDGRRIARIAEPEGDGIQAASDLVALIRKAVATARKAA